MLLARLGIAAADAGAAEDDLVVADVASTEGGTPRRERQVEPRDILDGSATLADEVMMAAQIGVETGRLTLRHHFAHQAGFGQRPQIVVDGGTRSPRIVAVYGAKDLVRGGMDGVLRQEFQHGVALRGGPQGGRLKCLVEFQRSI